MRAIITENGRPVPERRYQIRVLDDNGEVARLRGDYRYLSAALMVLEEAGVRFEDITLNGEPYVGPEEEL